MRFIIYITLLINLLNAENINFDINENTRVDEIVLEAIKNNECFKEEGNCISSIIRINKEEDIKIAIDNNITVEKKLIKCLNPSNCVLKAHELIKLGIINFDNGSYQINYKYHPIDDLLEYFEESKEKVHVNNILMSLIKQWGYSWTTLGRYHHSPESDYNRNYNYYNKLSNYIESKKLKIN